MSYILEQASSGVGQDDMRTGLRNGLCIAGLALSLAGCAAGELFQVAGTTAFTFMVAPFPQTYRLSVEGMSLPAEQSEGKAFPAELHKNIYVSEIDGIEILKHLDGIRLDRHDAGNLKAALGQSLDLAGLLNEDPNLARYRLKTTVTDNRSEGFADILVTTRMQFVLTDVATGETVAQEAIATPSTVPVSEAPLYKDRVGKAMEGSVRGDLQALLERLSQLRIEEPTAP